MTVRNKLLTTALLLAIPFGPALSQEAGDAAKGEKEFRKCKACHQVGEKAKNVVGPVLNNVIGRHAGTAEGFRYSKLNQAAGAAGLVWTEENILAYLPDPNAFLKDYLKEAGKEDQAKGSTRMTFRLKNEEQARDILAYLKTFSKEQ